MMFVLLLWCLKLVVVVYEFRKFCFEWDELQDKNMLNNFFGEFFCIVVVSGFVQVCGVCENNFKEVDVFILCNVFVVFLGVFGFGKFLLVFGIIYVEVQ